MYYGYEIFPLEYSDDLKFDFDYDLQSNLKVKVIHLCSTFFILEMKRKKKKN